MVAYLIVDVDVKDPVRYAEYVQQVPPTIAKYGGKFLVRGGKTEVIEGTWQPKRVVVLEFESVARAKEWYHSEEYRGPRDIRWSASTANLIVVEGVAAPIL